MRGTQEDGRPSSAANLVATGHIRWPAEYSPTVCPIHAVNSIHAKAPLSRVWSMIVRASRWSTYYAHASDVIIIGGGELRRGSVFTWQTAGVRLACTVREFVPLRRIAWEALYQGSGAYHAWVFVPEPEGCYIHTEETQQGPFWVKNAEQHPGGLHHFHQVWLESLARAAAR